MLTVAYDHRDRLVHASAVPASAAPGGAPAAYDEADAYDQVGNFTSKAGDASPQHRGSCRHSMIRIRLFLSNGVHC